MPLLRKEPKERIREIWRGYHAERHDAVGMDMDASAASLLTDRAAAALVVPQVPRATRADSLAARPRASRAGVLVLPDFL